jgi:hypothetical protein
MLYARSSECKYGRHSSCAFKDSCTCPCHKVQRAIDKQAKEGKVLSKDAQSFKEWFEGWEKNIKATGRIEPAGAKVCENCGKEWDLLSAPGFCPHCGYAT